MNEYTINITDAQTAEYRQNERASYTIIRLAEQVKVICRLFSLFLIVTEIALKSKPWSEALDATNRYILGPERGIL